MHSKYHIVFFYLFVLPANLSLRCVLNSQSHVVKGAVEVLLADVDAAVFGSVEDVSDADPVEVVLALEGGPVAEDDAWEDFVAVDSFLKMFF